MPSWILPSDSHVPSDTGHTTDHNHIVDDLSLVATAFPGVTTGTPVTAHNTLDDGSGNATFAGNLIENKASGYANAIFVAPGDGAQYSNFNLADGVYPLDGVGHYWAFSHRVTPSHNLYIFNYNGASVYTNVLILNESGGVFTNHNTVDDGSGNSVLTGNLKLAAGTTSLAPQTFQSGTLNTTATAGVTEFDGTCFYATAQASSRQVVDTEQFTTLTSPYTLTSQTAAQKLFNATSNGAVTLEANTAYWFECWFTLSSMSASSGSFGFALGGSAGITSQMWETEGNKATLATAASAQNTANTAANTTIVTATTATVGWAKVWGKVRISTAGTLIPQVSLGVAAAAVVGADSYFRIWPAGATGVTAVGNWS